MNPILQRHARKVDWSALKQAYAASGWDNGRSPEELRRAFENSFRVCFACHAGRIVGTARAISDGVRCAAVFDVWVTPELRRLGIGRQMMEALLADLAGQFVILTTEVEAFYRPFGFRERRAMVIPDNHPSPSP
jgi:ribosomal protein S18 acetylase RimI-like enzyme